VRKDATAAFRAQRPDTGGTCALKRAGSAGKGGTGTEEDAMGPEPLPQGAAWLAVARCVARCVVLLARGEVHLPRGNIGRRIPFADGSVGRVYRETRLDRTPSDPCVLVVSFRLRGVRGRGHAAFRVESILNTPLFVGFPGVVSKLWLAHDVHGLYRGLYEWDGAERAERYARSLWRVLALVSEPESIDYRVLPRLHRDDVLADPALLERYASADDSSWWRVVAAA
jgi:hypothetical protein